MTARGAARPPVRGGRLGRVIEARSSEAQISLRGGNQNGTTPAQGNLRGGRISRDMNGEKAGWVPSHFPGKASRPDAKALPQAGSYQGDGEIRPRIPEWVR